MGAARRRREARIAAVRGPREGRKRTAHSPVNEEKSGECFVNLFIGYFILILVVSSFLSVALAVIALQDDGLAGIHGRADITQASPSSSGGHVKFVLRTSDFAYNSHNVGNGREQEWFPYGYDRLKSELSQAQILYPNATGTPSDTVTNNVCTKIASRLTRDGRSVDPNTSIPVLSEYIKPWLCPNGIEELAAAGSTAHTGNRSASRPQSCLPSSSSLCRWSCALPKGWS